MNAKKPLLSIVSHLVAALVFACSTSVGASDHLEIGAGLHLGQGKTYDGEALARLKQLGFSSFRDEAYWHRFEKSPNAFEVSNVPTLLRAALSDAVYGPRAMLALAYGNRLYDGGGRPVSEYGREAFKRYSLAVSKTFPQVGYLEIWNEWNHPIGVPDNSRGTAQQYAELVKLVAPALRESGTKAKIIVGALADDYPDWEFAKQLVQHGILPYADGFSVHLYNHSMGGKAHPQEMFRRLERLQAILRQGNGGHDFPIFVTEIGWPTHSSRHGVSEHTAGAKLAQFLLEAYSYPWIRGLWLYELYDSGNQAVEREHNFGILKSDGERKQSACFVSAALAISKNSRFAGRGSLRGGVSWVAFESENITTYVLYLPENRLSGRFESTVEIARGIVPLCKYSKDFRSSKPGAEWGEIVLTSEPLVLTVPNRGFDFGKILR